MSIESLYVKDVYDQIGDRFSSSRHSPWPSVKSFIQSLPDGSLVLDAGCGNGKNMLIRPTINMIGCDVSNTLLEICSTKGLNVVEANIINLPFKDNTFDAVICVAVLHHLSSHERRTQAVKEMLRVVKPGGKLFIEVWALEQNLTAKKFFKIENNLNDYFVLWENKHQRYYHLFDKEEMTRMFPTGEIGFQKDNWHVTLTKLT